MRAADRIDERLVPVDLGRVIGRHDPDPLAILDSRDVTIVLASRELTITADLLPGLYVLGSEAMIETVLDNLIDNAISFSPSGDEILVHLTHDGSSADLTVSDRGRAYAKNSSNASSIATIRSVAPMGRITRMKRQPPISGSDCG